jgi:hypothetical protein
MSDDRRSNRHDRRRSRSPDDTRHNYHDDRESGDMFFVTILIDVITDLDEFTSDQKRRNPFGKPHDRRKKIKRR